MHTAATDPTAEAGPILGHRRWAQALQAPAELSQPQSRLMIAAVACAHLAGVWALLQVPAVREAVRQVAPMMVELVAPAQPPEPAPPPPPTPSRPPPRALPAAPPILAAPVAAPLAAATFTAPELPAPAAPAPLTVALTPAPAAPPSPPPLPARRAVPPTAVQYLKLPPVEVPLASRRAGESGVVWLRLVVDVHGLPAQIHVQRSSGFARLDEQALWAMRQARFKPQTEDGTPIELEVTAPIEYLLD